MGWLVCMTTIHLIGTLSLTVHLGGSRTESGRVCTYVCTPGPCWPLSSLISLEDCGPKRLGHIYVRKTLESRKRWQQDLANGIEGRGKGLGWYEGDATCALVVAPHWQYSNCEAFQTLCLCVPDIESGAPPHGLCPPVRYSPDMSVYQSL